MNVWKLTSRVWTLILCSLAFLAHFWVPLFSIDHTQAVGRNALVPFVGGSSALHYMSVGLLPFLISGLMVGIIPLLNPEHNQLFLRFKKPLQRVILYVLAFLYSYQTLSVQPSAAFKYGLIVTWVELMLSVWTIEQLLDVTKKTGLLETPLTWFLALSVVGTFVSAIYSFTISSSMVAAVVLTIIISFFAYQKSYDVNATVRHFLGGRLSLENITLNTRLMHVGLMPFIFFTMFTSPFLPMFDSRYVSYASIVSYFPWFLIVIFTVVKVLVMVLSKLYLRRSQAVAYSMFWSLQMDGNPAGSTSPFLKILWAQSLFTASVITVLIGIQSFSISHWGSEAVSQFAGGISWLIVASAIADVRSGLQGDYHVIR